MSGRNDSNGLSVASGGNQRQLQAYPVMMNDSTRFSRAFRALVALMLLLGLPAGLSAVTGPRCASMHMDGITSEAVDERASVFTPGHSSDASHDHSGPEPASVASCTVAAIAAPRSEDANAPQTSMQALPDETIRPVSAPAPPPYQPPRI